MPKQATMVYRKAADGAQNVHEHQGQKYEWQIVELEDDEPAPAGWSRSIGEEPTADDKPKRGRKPKADQADESEPVNGDSDGN